MKYKSKLPLFLEFNFLKEHIYANKATSLIFVQIVFDFITEPVFFNIFL